MATKQNGASAIRGFFDAQPSAPHVTDRVREVSEVLSADRSSPELPWRRRVVDRLAIRKLRKAANFDFTDTEKSEVPAENVEFPLGEDVPVALAAQKGTFN